MAALTMVRLTSVSQDVRQLARAAITRAIVRTRGPGGAGRGLSRRADARGAGHDRSVARLIGLLSRPLPLTVSQQVVCRTL